MYPPAKLGKLERQKSVSLRTRDGRLEDGYRRSHRTLRTRVGWTNSDVGMLCKNTALFNLITHARGRGGLAIHLRSDRQAAGGFEDFGRPGKA